MAREKKELQSLIITHTRRLKVLKERQATMGISTPPEVIIEIEDIEGQLRQLQVDLSAFSSPGQSQHPTAPVVHIHNWGVRPTQPPQATVVFDWVSPGKFVEHDDQAKTRSVPSSERWREELLPQLRSLPNETAPQGWIRLQGKCALSTGFAFGTIFRAKERYQIEVAQFIPDKGATEYWASNGQPPGGVPPPTFTLHLAEGTDKANHQGLATGDAIIVVGALTTKTINEILEDVGTYFGEAEAFAEIPQGRQTIDSAKGLLVLEAQAATRERRPLEGWEVAGLARSSNQLVNNFKQRVKPEKLHLFMAAPLSLAVFMAHHWTNIRKPIQCYEEVRTEQVYAPACVVNVQ